MAHNHPVDTGESPTVQHEEAVHLQSLEHTHVPQLGAAPAQITAALTGDDELLRKIIKHVPFTDRHESCPLVCKKVRTYLWRRVPCIYVMHTNSVLYSFPALFP